MYKMHLQGLKVTIIWEVPIREFYGYHLYQLRFDLVGRESPQMEDPFMEKLI